MFVVFLRSEWSQVKIGVLRAREGGTGAAPRLTLATATSWGCSGLGGLRNHIHVHAVVLQSHGPAGSSSRSGEGGTARASFPLGTSLREPTVHFLVCPGSWDMCVLFGGGLEPCRSDSGPRLRTKESDWLGNTHQGSWGGGWGTVRLPPGPQVTMSAGTVPKGLRPDHTREQVHSSCAVTPQQPLGGRCSAACWACAALSVARGRVLSTHPAPLLPRGRPKDTGDTYSWV